MSVVLSGSGLYTPPNSVSNEELVKVFNQFVDNFNDKNQHSINKGLVQRLEYSSSEFIEKASGIKSRFFIEKKGILDPNIMYPIIEERGDTNRSVQCEISMIAAKEALKNANKMAKDIDAVIVACSNMQRPYPAIAIELQDALNIEGFAFDLNVACSSATFAIATAKGLIDSGQAKSVLIVNPEICSAHLNFKDRDSHFIFGDVCTALVVEQRATSSTQDTYKIVDISLQTQFSNNIRNNFGFLSRLNPETAFNSDKLFKQNGRKVFKEVSLQVTSIIQKQLSQLNLNSQHLKRLWLHQANAHMNNLIAEKILGHKPSQEIAPLILDDYANTASAGSIIAFHKYKQNIDSGNYCLLSSFGAGYSIGSIILLKN